jgi:predicted transport protein
MSALKIGDYIALEFATVMDELTLGMDEDDEVKEVTDRNYWEKRGTKATVKMADEILEFIKTFDASINLKYNKFYIGLATNGQPNNFAIFRAQKSHLRLEVRLPQSEEFEERLEETGLDIMDYEKKWGKYRIRLKKADIKKHQEFLIETLKLAYDNSNS